VLSPKATNQETDQHLSVQPIYDCMMTQHNVTFSSKKICN